MPVLKNTRHEYFAQSMAKGKSQRQAYIDAGYDCSNENIIDAAASRLLSNVKVSARITELKERAAVKTEVTIQSLLEELEAARVAAMGAEVVQSSAAVSASMAKAKLLGLVIDKTKAEIVDNIDVEIAKNKLIGAKVTENRIN